MSDMSDELIKVLLVEDNPGDSRLIKELLSDTSSSTFEIETTERLSDALTILRERRFDVILLDLSLPDSTGLETLIKAQAKVPQLAIIVLTGLDDESMAVEAVRRGAQDYLVKGQIDSNLLSRAIRYAIERKQSEEELQASEDRFKSLFEFAPDAYYLNDQNGNFINGNKAVEELFGYKKEELIGKNFLEAYLLPSDQVPKAAELFAKNLKGYPTGPDELILKTKNGQQVEVEIRTLPVKIKDQDVVLGIARDITERKRLEKQLRYSQKMEAIGTLAGGVAHDLNNILAGLVSYPDLILTEIPDDSPLRKHLLTIKMSGKKAAAIVQDLLTLSRRGVSVEEVLNLNDIIPEYLKSPEYERLKSFHPDVQVETNLESDLLNILGSSVHLSKTLMNLVSNAAEAMPDGGKIIISTENRYIDRPIRGHDDVEEGDYIIMKVSDNGIGLSSVDEERIFEPFYTKKAMGRSGTGLGMTVVWGTVKDHKGFIDIQSIKGTGSTFTLYFPASRQELDRYKSILPIEDFMGNGESILIIDDVEEQREIASLMMKKLGYSDVSVASGEEAINYLKNNTTDLLILDMIMDPGIDGLETYKRILELHPRQKAIIASGFAETDHVKETKKLGAGQYIKKPYTLEKIGLAIRTELDK